MLRRLFEDALKQRRQEYGVTDSRTAQAARDLGLFLSRQSDQAGARSALSEAVGIDEKAFGATAAQTLADLAELATVSSPGDAEPLWQRSALTLVAAGALLAATATLVGAAVRFRRALPQTRAQRSLTRIQIVASVLWMVVFAGLVGFATAASNQAETLFGWPQPPLLVASMAALLAALWSAVGLIYAPLAWRAGDGWSPWRKLRSTATSLVFAALAIQLAFWGLLEPWAT